MESIKSILVTKMKYDFALTLHHLQNPFRPCLKFPHPPANRNRTISRTNPSCFPETFNRTLSPFSHPPAFTHRLTTGGKSRSNSSSCQRQNRAAATLSTSRYLHVGCRSGGSVLSVTSEEAVVHPPGRFAPRRCVYFGGSVRVVWIYFGLWRFLENRHDTRTKSSPPNPTNVTLTALNRT